ncbi:MAG: phosphate acetyltransferase [Eubacterium sp.]|nr:phosphate acetyltransferase [Eubacterium sp.]
MGFIDGIYEKAKKKKCTIAIPEVTNEYMIKAAVKVSQDEIADVILVGNPEDVSETAKAAGVDVSGLRIVDIGDEELKKELLERYDRSPDKAMPRKFIEKRVNHPLYLATLLQAVGEADGTIAGVDTTTYEFVLAAKSIIGMQPNCPTASGLLVEEIEGFEGEQGNLIGMSDGAVCIQPDVEQHAGIAISSCETFEALTGREARCAFLSFSTDGSGGLSEPVKKVREAVALAQKLRPDLKIDGEFQADAAIDERIGKKKVKRESEVAGKANVLIFPDAAGCNIGSKLVQRLANNVKVYGPVYQGFRLPILDCSRSDTDVELYNNIAILSVMAAAAKK